MNCPDCGAPLPLKALHSPAGYYVGRWCDNCGPYERVSASYYATFDEAEAVLKSGLYETRDYAIENQGEER